jgi:hypothetical protein
MQHSKGGNQILAQSSRDSKDALHRSWIHKHFTDEFTGAAQQNLRAQAWALSTSLHRLLDFDDKRIQKDDPATK